MSSSESITKGNDSPARAMDETAGTTKLAAEVIDEWFKVADSSSAVLEGGRLHARVNNRFVTLFRRRGKLSCIDSICHHAGGPLTLGNLQDIEELNMTVVLCPWHKFMVAIDSGVKAYQGVDFVKGKPVPTGWKVSKIVQRPHKVIDSPIGIYISLQITEEPCSSDNDANSELCAQDYEIHTTVVTPSTREEINAAVRATR